MIQVTSTPLTSGTEATSGITRGINDLIGVLGDIQTRKLAIQERQDRLARQAIEDTRYTEDKDLKAQIRKEDLDIANKKWDYAIGKDDQEYRDKLAADAKAETTGQYLAALVNTKTPQERAKFIKSLENTGGIDFSKLATTAYAMDKDYKSDIMDQKKLAAAYAKSSTPKEKSIPLGEMKYVYEGTDLLNRANEIKGLSGKNAITNPEEARVIIAKHEADIKKENDREALLKGKVTGSRSLLWNDAGKLPANETAAWIKDVKGKGWSQKDINDALEAGIEDNGLFDNQAGNAFLQSILDRNKKQK